jgi:hypothetical protein
MILSPHAQHIVIKAAKAKQKLTEKALAHRFHCAIHDIKNTLFRARQKGQL